MTILSITSVEKELESVFGFGSYFRGEFFNDVDVLAVAAIENVDTLGTYYKLSRLLGEVTERFGWPLDLTLLTSEEFKTRPLHNMNELQCLWSVSK